MPIGDGSSVSALVKGATASSSHSQIAEATLDTSSRSDATIAKMIATSSSCLLGAQCDEFAGKVDD
ncbi:hypothetical protein CBS101457_005106 [Exobasidium rhododendri]|nr:hypothetical protein CBS101457_005106 [Exobasidium rhododendri]